MFDLRLIRADALKLRRRRGMLALCGVLTTGVVALIFIARLIQQASDPFDLPVGGAMAYHETMFILTLMVFVAGAIIGATAGTQDLESGVFRDLAATGRSRLALFGARIPGALAVVLPIAAIAAAVVAVASLALASGTIAPDPAMIFPATAAVLTAGGLSTIVAVGLAALTGSRPATITSMLAFMLALAPLLAGSKFLGDARQAIPTEAVFRIGHLDSGGYTDVGLVTAITVVLAWAAAAFAAGAWRTRSREI